MAKKAKTWRLLCQRPSKKAKQMLGTALTVSITTEVAVKLKGSTTHTNWQKKPPKVKNVMSPKVRANQLK